MNRDVAKSAFDAMDTLGRNGEVRSKCRNCIKKLFGICLIFPFSSASINLALQFYDEEERKTNSLIKSWGFSALLAKPGINFFYFRSLKAFFRSGSDSTFQ